jgi:CBS domain-containing protein
VVPGAVSCAAPRRPARLSRRRPLTEPSAVAEFLGHQPPFDGLDEHELEAIAGAALECEFAAGRTALVEDGEPTQALFVIATGSMDLEHDGHVVDVLEPGECFGHPSLLSGMAPAFTVRAREPSRCYAIPREPALRALGSEAGARYVALSLRERLVRTGYTAHALPEVATLRLGALVDRPALVLAPGTTVRDAAAAMTEHHVTAALVRAGAEVGMVTDADLRERVLAFGRSPDEPVLAAARVPAPRAPADRTAGEALVDLLDLGVRELCVEAPDGHLLGVLTVEQIAGGEHSPFVLRRALAQARDEEALVLTATTGLPRLLNALLSAGLSPADIGRVLSVQSDTATARLTDFAMERLGQAPCAWAWLGLGSVARRELTLASDQDNALAYADPGGPEVDAYFEALATSVNEGLARCGFGADRADVLARSPAWRMTASRWREVFEACLEHPDRSHLVRAAVSFDFRHVAGGLPITGPLVEVVRGAREHPDFIRRLARTATDWKVALRRRGGLATDDDGTFDIKRGGVLPIINLGRLHAISAGITVSGTLDRLLAAERVGQIEPETAEGLREAWGVTMRARLEHHAECVRTGRAADNRVAPHTLPPLRRAELREALRAVQAAQKRIPVFAPPRM